MVTWSGPDVAPAGLVAAGLLPPPPPIPCSPATAGDPATAPPAAPLVRAVCWPRSPKTMCRAYSYGRMKSQTNSNNTANTNITMTMSMPVMRARTGAATAASQAGQTVPALSFRAWKVFPHRLQTCSIYLTLANFVAERVLLARSFATARLAATAPNRTENRDWLRFHGRA
jgi:hypothetical protein